MGAGCRACLGRGNRGLRKGSGIRIHPPALMRGSSGLPAEDAEPGFPTSEGGDPWGPLKPSRGSLEHGIALETALRGWGNQDTRLST